MVRVRVLRGTQEYRKPSSCLGPFGDPVPSVGEVVGGLGGVHRTRQSTAGVHRSKKKGAGRGFMISVFVGYDR